MKRFDGAVLGYFNKATPAEGADTQKHQEAFAHPVQMNYRGGFKMETNVFDWLQSWFLNHANGDWEHQHGVTIETLDNPGWHVSIDLEGTEIEKKEFISLRNEAGEHDWMTCRVENKKFEGFCGPNSLQKVLSAFREWVVSN